VVERNGSLDDGPGLVNSAPYGDGWLLVVEPEDTAQLADMLSEAEYEQLTADK
jgi:glycine cleavage system H protein